RALDGKAGLRRPHIGRLVRRLATRWHGPPSSSRDVVDTAYVDRRGDAGLNWPYLAGGRVLGRAHPAIRARSAPRRPTVRPRPAAGGPCEGGAERVGGRGRREELGTSRRPGRAVGGRGGRRAWPQ